MRLLPGDRSFGGASRGYEPKWIVSFNSAMLSVLPHRINPSCIMRMLREYCGAVFLSSSCSVYSGGVSPLGSPELDALQHINILSSIVHLWLLPRSSVEHCTTWRWGVKMYTLSSIFIKHQCTYFVLPGVNPGGICLKVAVVAYGVVGQQMGGFRGF